MASEDRKDPSATTTKQDEDSPSTVSKQEETELSRCIPQLTGCGNPDAPDPMYEDVFSSVMGYRIGCANLTRAALAYRDPGLDAMFERAQQLCQAIFKKEAEPSKEAAQPPNQAEPAKKEAEPLKEEAEPAKKEAEPLKEEAEPAKTETEPAKEPVAEEVSTDTISYPRRCACPEEEDCELCAGILEYDDDPITDIPEMLYPCPVIEVDHTRSLMAKVRNGDHDTIIRILLERGADPNGRDKSRDDNTPLIYAASFGHARLVSLLLGENVDVDAQNANGRTALMEAAINGHLKIVQKLCIAKANIMLVDRYDQTAVSLAEYRGHRDIVQFLKRAAIVRLADTVAAEGTEARVDPFVGVYQPMVVPSGARLKSKATVAQSAEVPRVTAVVVPSDATEAEPSSEEKPASPQ